MHKNRVILADILTATAGHQVCNKYLEKEMQAAIEDQELEATQDEIEKLCYRIRVQMSHLRDANIQKFAIPQRFAAANGLVHMITVGDPPVAAKKRKKNKSKKTNESSTPKAQRRKLDRSENSASQSASATSPMPRFDATHRNQHLLALAGDEADDDSDNSVQEVEIAKVPAPRVDLEMELDDVLADLFTHPQPLENKDEPVTSTPPKKVGQSINTPEKLDNPKVVVNYKAVESVLLANSMNTPPPTLAEYNKLSKRPAVEKKENKTR